MTRGRLGMMAYTAGWERGRRISLEDVIREVMGPGSALGPATHEVPHASA
jgi:hypothetical protein